MGHRVTRLAASVFGSLATIVRRERTLGPELCVPAFRPVCLYRRHVQFSNEKDPAIRCLPDSPGLVSSVVFPWSGEASENDLWSLWADPRTLGERGPSGSIWLCNRFYRERDGLCSSSEKRVRRPRAEGRASVACQTTGL